ncbi:MAG: CorA family divalent cation transporter [bacterium]
MYKKRNYRTVTWVDSENPTKEEARQMMDQFNLEPQIAQDILLPTYKDKMIVHKDYIYFVLHFPAFRHTHTKSYSQEIDFVLGRDFIITNRYETIDALDKYSRIFETNTILDKNETEIGSGEIFLSMIKTVYQTLSDELDSISTSLAEVEKKIFAGKEKEMVIELSSVARQLINFNHIIASHGDILEQLKHNGTQIFSPNFALELDSITNEYFKISKILENLKALMLELKDTNDSLLSTKTNETMKVLTVFTFLALPFSVITGFFQMNTAYNTDINPNAQWLVIVAIEITVTLIIFAIAKKKKWF